jgi:D-lactate dehydrogenase
MRTRTTSRYQLVPGAVVTPTTPVQVAAVLRAAGRSVTFRSGGTSLSGQANARRSLRS